MTSPKSFTTQMSNASAESPLSHKPSYVVAAGVSLAIFVLYLLTLAPTTGMWDAGEYMAAAADLGLPHPPGNPFFMLIAHFFGLLPISASYAVRLNVLAAISSAVAAGFWFLVTERVLASWFPERWQRITGGIIAAVIGATAFTVWNQSVVSEKVYTVSLMFFAVVAWLMVRWSDEPDAPGADRILLLVAFLMGLGYANHPAGFLTAPAVLAVVAVRRPWKFIQANEFNVSTTIIFGLVTVIGLVFVTTIFGWLPLAGAIAVAAIAWMRAKSIRRFPLVFAVVGMLGLGLTPFAYLPIRAAWFPKMNSGEPTACVTKISVACTFSKETLKRTKEHIDREQYGQKLERGAPYSAQVGMWWLYFKWQWIRDINGVSQLAQHAFAVIFLGLGLLGGYVHWKRDRRSFWFFGPLVFTMTLALIYYLNFKYGASQSPELGNAVDREVRDRDYFYIWSFSAWGVWSALGLMYVWETIAELFGRGKGGEESASKTKPAFPARRNMLLATPILAIAFVPLFANWNPASRAGETFTLDWARDMLNSVEPYGILITNGDNDTYPLWYAQEGEGIRKDVIVIVTSYLNMNWAIRQLIRNPIHPYDSLAGPAIYRGTRWKKPEHPPLNLTFTEADALPPYVALSQPQIFEHGKIKTTIPAGYLRADQMAILRMIKDSYPSRPIYFAARYTDIGADDYLVATGLGYKLMPDIPVESDSIQFVNGEFIDVPTTYDLWTKVYKGPQSLIKQGRWMDGPSRNIPVRYAITGLTLSAALKKNGKVAEASQIEQTVKSLAKVSGISNYFGF